MEWVCAFKLFVIRKLFLKILWAIIIVFNAVLQLVSHKLSCKVFKCVRKSLF